jgi:hypothetical protein
MLLTLGFPKPPDNITALQLFDKVHFLFYFSWVLFCDSLFLVYFFGGLECVGHFFAYVGHFVFEMSGFEPRELPYSKQAHYHLAILLHT